MNSSFSSTHEQMFGKNTFTLTFCECAENHAGMQKIGTKTSKGQGYTIANLQEIFNLYQNNSELHLLNHKTDQEEAGVLIIRNGLSLIGISDYYLFEEHNSLEKDTKYLTKDKRVLNKRARWNLCFADFDQVPDYVNGKGTIVNFNRLPVTNILRERLVYLGGNKASGLLAEGNYYYDYTKCGINWHGDVERRKVIGVRVGRTMPLCFRWYKDGQSEGVTYTFNINSGDVYIFSEKATGTDCYERGKWILKHSAGFDDFTD